ncbi:MAG: hypothetical protein V1909_02225, partial [Candidatus Micrarchaeota archaeon]
MRGYFLLFAAILLFFPASAFAQFCPVEKIPTETQIYVDRNIASGVAQVTATLTAISLATKATSPLPKETMWFQECAIGNFSSGCPASYSHTCGGIPQDYWKCESTCCMAHQSKPTDADGKSSVLFPLMENTTYIAVYLGGDAYQPSNSTGSFLYPPMLGALDIGACFPLFLVLGLLMLSMSAMGKSPIGAFDFSSLRAPRAKQRAPTAYVVSTAAIVKMVRGVKSGIEYNNEKDPEKKAALAKDIKNTFQGKGEGGKKGKKDVLDRALDIADATWARNLAKKTGGSKNLFKVFGKVGKGIGWVADKQLRIMTAGTIGATGGRVPLVKLVGSGLKVVGKGLKKFDDKIGHVPSFVGVGAYIVGKNVLEGAKIATGKSDKVRFLGKKIFGLNFGLGFGGGQADYLQYAWDPTGLTKNALVANKHANSLKSQEIVNQGNSDRIPEFERRNKRFDELEKQKLVEKKNGEWAATEKGKKDANLVTELNYLKNGKKDDWGAKKANLKDLEAHKDNPKQNGLDIIYAREDVEKILKPYVIMSTGSNGLTEVSLTKEAKDLGFHLEHSKFSKESGKPEVFILKPPKGADEKSLRVCSYHNGDPTQLGTKGLSYKELYELAGLVNEVKDGKNNVRTSASADGAIYGYQAMGFALPKTARMRLDENFNLVVDESESGVKVPLLGVRIPDWLVTGVVQAANVASTIKSSSYVMKYGKIEQVGAMPTGESVQSGYSDATHGARSAAAEERRLETMNDIMKKDFTKLDQRDMNFLVMNAPPDVVQSIIEKNQNLPIRNSGLSLTDGTLKLLKEITEKERQGFNANDFRENRVTFTEHGKTADGKAVDITVDGNAVDIIMR